MPNNYNKLRGKIREAGKTCAEIAQEIGISPTSFSYKLSGKTDFLISEIQSLVSALNINPEETAAYFFCLKS
jgi:hypothetical protein